MADRPSGGGRWAATASRSPGPTAATRRRPTRTCSPPRWTGWSPGSAWPASDSARSSPARCSSTPATSTSPGRPCSAPDSTRRTPAYDIQQACGTGLEAAILVANKIALGTDRGRHRRRRRHHLRRAARRQRRAAPHPAARSTPHAPCGERLRAGRRLRPPSRSARRSRATPSRAPACPWASTPRSPRRAGSIDRRGAGRAGTGLAPAASPRRTSGVLRRPRHPVPRPDPRREPAPGHLAGEARHAPAGLRHARTPDGDPDRRQLVAARPTAPRWCCWPAEEWAARAQPAGAGLPGVRGDGRGRLRRTARRAC